MAYFMEDQEFQPESRMRGVNQSWENRGLVFGGVKVKTIW